MSDIESSIKALEEKLESLQEKERAQAEFDKQALVRFKANMATLKEYFPDLYDEMERFKPRDSFKIVAMSESVGNLVPEQASVPLYGKDPIQQARDQVERYTSNPKFGRTSLYRKRTAQSDDDRLHIRYMHKLANKISELTEEEPEKISSLPEFYPSAIIFGVGLGYHIPLLLDEHAFDYLFICEPDVELFYASLFCIDWTRIIEEIDESGRCLFIQVGITYEVFFDKLTSISQDIGAFALINSFCYQHYPSEEINALIKNFFKNFYQFQLGFGFYNDAITGLSHAIHNVNKGALFYRNNPESKKVTQHIPVFIVGNGPSLDEAIEVIRENQDKAIILAAGTGLQSLLKAGITPDFHVLVERPKHNYDVQCQTLPLEEYKKLNLLAVDVIYPDTLDLYKWSGLGLKGPEAATVFLQYMQFKANKEKLLSLPDAAPLVANTAMAFSSVMGFKEVYLFGVDNGYSVSGQSHSKLSIYNDKKFKGQFKARKGADKRLKGNLGEDVFATNLMTISKQKLEHLIGLVGDANVYNVGHGAFLEGATPLKPEDLLLANLPQSKPDYVEWLKESFFKTLSFTNIEQSLGLDEYKEMIDYLLEIGERPFNSRVEASDILKAQARVVYAYKTGHFPHLFHLVKGTLLYFHCPLITLLYTYQSEELTLRWFRDCLSIWQEFLSKIREDFPENYLTKCDYSLHSSK